MIGSFQSKQNQEKWNASIAYLVSFQRRAPCCSLKTPTWQRTAPTDEERQRTPPLMITITTIALMKSPTNNLTRSRWTRQFPAKKPSISVSVICDFCVTSCTQFFCVLYAGRQKMYTYRTRRCGCQLLKHNIARRQSEPTGPASSRSSRLLLGSAHLSASVAHHHGARPCWHPRWRRPLRVLFIDVRLASPAYPCKRCANARKLESAAVRYSDDRTQPLTVLCPQENSQKAETYRNYEKSTRVTEPATNRCPWRILSSARIFGYSSLTADLEINP